MKLYFLLITFLLLSCKKEGSDTLLSKQMVGRWQMTSYGGGFDGRVYRTSPDSVVILFKADETYQRFIEGRIANTGKYQLGQAQSIL
ncbi:hypothetical protein [Mucilaginibacter sp. PAMB04168]|uniref:hypothetical protein n=1 Tax=Mucilaginibacter sp. PAMB04168 TaxID=3138567 RepID=UPI0031F65975